MAGLAELFEDPETAGWILNALVRDLTVQLERRRNGLPMPPKMREVFEALGAVTDRQIPDSSSSGTSFGSVGSEVDSLFVSTRQAADRFGKSASYVRRLAQAGRIRACRVGRDWRVDPISLDNVLRRTL